MSGDGPGPSTTVAERTISQSILMSAGAFCTPRSVTRVLTGRRKPSADTIIAEMKTLMERGLGDFVLGGNTKAYYKPLPTDNNKQLIEATTGAALDEYKAMFIKTDIKYLTDSQFNRLLL